MGENVRWHLMLLSGEQLYQRAWISGTPETRPCIPPGNKGNLHASICTGDNQTRPACFMSDLVTSSFRLPWVATVAQIAGVDASGLVSMILEAVRTVRRNREECRHLGERVAMIGDLLGNLQGWDMMQVPEIRKPLHGLDETLREAYRLITSCQDASSMYRFFMGGRQAEQFREVHRKIDGYLQLYPVICHIDITRRLDQLRDSVHPSSTTTHATSSDSGARRGAPEGRRRVDKGATSSDSGAGREAPRAGGVSMREKADTMLRRHSCP
ncbi:hypothetical protein ACP4OV_003887 [Aristida adscensionis]